MPGEPCGICGGDGRVSNSFSGSTAQCPGCRGTGRRSEEALFRDVTKTKPSHYQPAASKAAAAPKQQGPATHEGVQLANEVRASSLAEAAKTKLVLEIAEHEATHGKCTQTFVKKVRKQLRGPSGS